MSILNLIKPGNKYTLRKEAFDEICRKTTFQTKGSYPKQVTISSIKRSGSRFSIEWNFGTYGLHVNNNCIIIGTSYARDLYIEANLQEPLILLPCNIYTNSANQLVWEF